MDVDLKIQLQMVRDRFFDGQADRSLRRHLDSSGANTPMIEIADSSRIWERHCEPEIRPQRSTDRGPIHVTAQVSEEGPTPAIPPEMKCVEDTIRRHDKKTIADAGTSAFTGSSEIYRQGHSGTANEGSDLPNNASGTETTTDD